MIKNLKAFVEKQEMLNNIQTSLVKLYEKDELVKDEAYLAELTEKTFEAISYMDEVFKNLLNEPTLNKVAEDLRAQREDVATDIIELMLFSTIARQNIEIEELHVLIDKINKQKD